MKKFVIALILPVMAVLAGCASQIGANQYDLAAVGSVNRARAGTIVSVRAITVADSDNSLGTAIGGIAGGVAGSQIGKGSTAGVLGAVGGAWSAARPAIWLNAAFPNKAGMNTSSSSTTADWSPLLRAATC